MNHAQRKFDDLVMLKENLVMLQKKYASLFFVAIASPLKEITHPSSRRCHMLRQ